uniref:Uncharacterized protein n=1 Tax=Anopheles stephensi TaxID=30069 RepID=A0A182XV07_ANOST
MSRGLMEFVQNSKKALAVGEKGVSGRAKQPMHDGKAWMAATKSNGSPGGTAPQRATAISETELN